MTAPVIHPDISAVTLRPSVVQSPVVVAGTGAAVNIDPTTVVVAAEISTGPPGTNGIIGSDGINGATGPQGPKGDMGSGFRFIGDIEPDTSDWNVDDLWLDTSTE